MLEMLEMAPDSVYPEQVLQEELIMLVREGMAQCKLGDRTVELTKDAVLYLTPGTKRKLKSGPAGFEVIEVFSPVRIDHLQLAGVEFPTGGSVEFPDQGVTPSLESGTVYNLTGGIHEWSDTVDSAVIKY